MTKGLLILTLLVPLHSRGDFSLSSFTRKILTGLFGINRGAIDRALAPKSFSSPTFCTPKIVADGPMPTGSGLARHITLSHGFNLKNSVERRLCRDVLTNEYTNWYRSTFSSGLIGNMVFPPAALLQHCEESPPHPLAKIIQIADSFNRQTRRGRTECKRAVSNWYEKNSMWSHLNKEERLVKMIDLSRRAASRLKRNGTRIHRDLNLGILSCVGKIESGRYYPEVVQLASVCNKYCNKIYRDDTVPFESDPSVCRTPTRDDWEGKNLSVGFGQVTARTFYGNEEAAGKAEQMGLTGGLGELSSNPDAQTEMKLLHLNANIMMFARGRRDLDIFIGVGDEENKCDPRELSLAEKAVALYDQGRCKSYMRKFYRCMDTCFPNPPSLTSGGLSRTQRSCIKELRL